MGEGLDIKLEHTGRPILNGQRSSACTNHRGRAGVLEPNRLVSLRTDRYHFDRPGNELAQSVEVGMRVAWKIGGRAD